MSILPHTINQPYCVTSNLGFKGRGIIIESSGVTVALTGISLTGDTGEAMTTASTWLGV